MSRARAVPLAAEQGYALRMKRFLAAFLGIAMGVYIPFQAWRRARRRGISAEAAFREISEEAWAGMSPEMKAEVDPNRARREASSAPVIANPS